MSETPDGPKETPEAKSPEATPEASPEAKRRLKRVVVGAVAFVLVALIAIALFFTSSKSGPSCDAWLKAEADYLAQVPPIQQKTVSDGINFDGRFVFNGKTYVRPSGCK